MKIKGFFGFGAGFGQGLGKGFVLIGRELGFGTTHVFEGFLQLGECADDLALFFEGLVSLFGKDRLTSVASFHLGAFGEGAGVFAVADLAAEFAQLLLNGALFGKQLVELFFFQFFGAQFFANFFLLFEQLLHCLGNVFIDGVGIFELANLAKGLFECFDDRLLGDASVGETTSLELGAGFLDEAFDVAGLDDAASFAGDGAQLAGPGGNLVQQSGEVSVHGGHVTLAVDDGEDGFFVVSSEFAGGVMNTGLLGDQLSEPGDELGLLAPQTQAFALGQEPHEHLLHAGASFVNCWFAFGDGLGGEGLVEQGDDFGHHLYRQIIEALVHALEIFVKRQIGQPIVLELLQVGIEQRGQQFSR